MSDQTVPVREKHRLLLRISHWLNFPLTLLMLWSGALIYWAHQPYIRIPDDLGPFRIHHRLAEGMGWHFFLMWPFVINGLIYLLYLMLTGDWKQLIPTKKSLRQVMPYLLYDLKLGTKKPVWTGRYNPVQQLAYLSVLLATTGSIITGLAIYKPVQLGMLTSLLGGYEAARFEHFLCMLFIKVFILIHIIQVIRAGWNNFRAMVAGYEIIKD